MSYLENKQIMVPMFCNLKKWRSGELAVEKVIQIFQELLHEITNNSWFIFIDNSGL